MPRGFSEGERATIQAQLLEQGQKFLSTYGLRKTSVEDLTGAVGISKGAFYLFFPSKEDLFFTIFEQFEADYRMHLLQLVAEDGTSPETRLRAFFQQAFSLWRTNPLFRHFGREEFMYLTRKLPAERLQANLHDDTAFAAELLARWRETGIDLRITPQEFTGLMRALFFVSLHADDIGLDVYPATIDLLTNLLARHFGGPSAAQGDADHDQS